MFCLFPSPDPNSSVSQGLGITRQIEREKMKGQLGLSQAQDLRDDKVTGKSQQYLLNLILGFSREIELEKKNRERF